MGQPQMSTNNDVQEQIRRTFETLHGTEPANPAELRVLRSRTAPRSGCFSKADAFAEVATKIDSDSRASLYITLNPVLYRSPMNKDSVSRAPKGGVAADEDVVSLRWLFLDFDPDRPSGVAATDDEKENGKLQMEVARTFFNLLGWPQPIVADSGNGFHLLYPIELPNDKSSRQLVKAVTAEASKRFSTKEVKLDSSVSNPARITRLYGTMNRKGLDNTERPWRRSELLIVPENRVLLTLEQLRGFIGPQLSSPRLPHQQPTPGQAMELPGRLDGGTGIEPFDMEAYLEAARIAHHRGEKYNDGTRWVLDCCPFNSTHDRGEVAMLVNAEGKPGFNCFHDSCEEYRGWTAFEQAFRNRLVEDGEDDRIQALDALGLETGYFNRDGGLFFALPGQPRRRLGDPLTVMARVRTEDSLGWGVALRWRDPDGKEKDLVVSSSDLVSDPKLVLARLADGGYRMETHNRAKESLVSYMLQFKAPSAMRADHPGWHGEAYVFPDEVIGETSEPVHYVRSGRATAEYATAGTLDQWTDQIGRYCSGNSRLLLAVSAAFAGPLLGPTNNETGGIHLRGGTSTGKTTALQVAGSVCGGGGTTGYMRQWRATTNGLEGVAAAHNDGLLVLDELGQISGRELADAIYTLSNQSGKSRAMKDGSLAMTRHWRTMILSSGEISPSEHAQEAGKKIRGGVEVRLLTIPADAGRGLGLYEDIYAFGSAAGFSDYLKVQAKLVYGTPLREFIKWLCKNRAEAKRRVEEIQEEFLKRHKPEKASNEVGRALHRFGLLAAAGELATQAGVTGWAQGEAIKAAGVCFTAWLEDRGGAGASDVDKGVEQVLAFLEKHSARFEREWPSLVPRDRVGFLRRNGELTEFQILPQMFRDEVCTGRDHKSIRDALITRGLMIPGDKSHPGQLQARFAELGQQWVYVMKVEAESREDFTVTSVTNAEKVAA